MKMGASIAEAQIRPVESAPHQFEISGLKNLNENEIEIPADLTADATLIFLVFQRNQQDTVDRWIAQAQPLFTENQFDMLELLIIDDPGALIRFFIETGIQNEITDPYIRERVAILYQDTAQFMKKHHIFTKDQITVLALDRRGEVMQTFTGEPPRNIITTLQQLKE